MTLKTTKPANPMMKPAGRNLVPVRIIRGV